MSSEGVTVEADQLQAGGALGISVEGPVKTCEVQSTPNEGLRVEAPSGSLQLVGSQGVSVQTGIGGVEVSAVGDISLVSQNGNVRFRWCMGVICLIQTIFKPILLIIL